MNTKTNYEKFPVLFTEAVIEDGISLPLLPVYRCPNIGQRCRLDWLSFTFHVTSISVSNDTDRLHNSDSNKQAYMEAVVSKISYEIEAMTGFGIEKKAQSGQNFYEHTYILEHNAGSISIGGQRDTILVTINGTGCTFAKHGWEFEMQAFLEFCHKPKITRVDICFDDLDGLLVTPDWADQMDDINGFTNRGRSPKIEKFGNWKRPDGNGRTVYIGSKKSSKFCRIYEKGKQLGRPDSNWVRVEVQYKGKHYKIPFDVITNPTGAFINAYPCFDQIFTDNFTKEVKPEVIKQSKLISLEKTIDITKNQFGRTIYALRDIFGDDKTVLDILTNIENKTYPERLDVLTIPTQ